MCGYVINSKARNKERWLAKQHAFASLTSFTQGIAATVGRLFIQCSFRTKQGVYFRIFSIPKGLLLLFSYTWKETSDGFADLKHFYYASEWAVSGWMSQGSSAGLQNWSLRQVWWATYFYKSSFIVKQSCSFISSVSVAVLGLQWRSWVIVVDSVWLAELKIVAL